MFFISTGLSAQNKVDNPVEINVSAGGPGYILGLKGGRKSTFSATSEIKYTPVKWLSVGLSLGLHDLGNYVDAEPAIEGEVERTYYFNTMLVFYGNWLTKKNLRMYSGIGYGTVNNRIDNGHIYHGFQITPVGISFGNKVFGFAELGMGWMFFPARAGIGVRF